MLELCNIFQEIIITVLHYYDIYGYLQYNVFHFYYNENYLCINLHQIKKTKNERKKKSSLPTHFLANWMITISEFSLFSYPTISQYVLSISLSTMIHNVKLVVPQKTLLLLIKKKQVIETKFLCCLCYFFLSRLVFC